MKSLKDKSLGGLIKEADAVFSEYIRRRFAVNSGYVSCFICGVPMHWKQAQCAHFLRRELMPTRYNEMNCHQSCESCNCYDVDHYLRYRERMIEAYGETRLLHLQSLAHGLQKFVRVDIQEIIDSYKQKIKEL